MKIIPNFSPNHSKKTRSTKDIRFIIIHYTGMQSEIESIKRLKDPEYKVSCHYLINKAKEKISHKEGKFFRSLGYRTFKKIRSWRKISVEKTLHT